MSSLSVDAAGPSIESMRRKRLGEEKTEVGGGGMGRAEPSGKERGTYTDGKRRGVRNLM